MKDLLSKFLLVYLVNFDFQKTIKWKDFLRTFLVCPNSVMFIFTTFATWSEEVSGEFGPKYRNAFHKFSFVCLIFDWSFYESCPQSPSHRDISQVSRKRLVLSVKTVSTNKS